MWLHQTLVVAGGLFLGGMWTLSCGMWAPDSLTKDWTWTPWSLGLGMLDHQESPGDHLYVTESYMPLRHGSCRGFAEGPPRRDCSPWFGTASLVFWSKLCQCMTFSPGIMDAEWALPGYVKFTVLIMASACLFSFSTFLWFLPLNFWHRSSSHCQVIWLAFCESYPNPSRSFPFVEDPLLSGYLAYKQRIIKDADTLLFIWLKKEKDLVTSCRRGEM